MDSLPWLVAAFSVGVALVTDLRQFRIPNALTLPLLLTGLAYHGWHHGFAGLVTSAVGAFAGGLILLPLYLVGGMGAGDIKLMAALGAWLKTARTLDVLIVSLLLTAMVSFVMSWRRNLRATAEISEGERGGEIARASLPLPEATPAARLRVEDVAQSEDRRGRLIPFGVMVAVGLVVAWVRKGGG